MPTSFTTNLRLSNPGLGDTGWGSTVSNGMIDLVDPAIAGTTTLSADTDVILTTANGMTDQARQMILNCTGSRAAQRTITAPASSKVYVVINGTTGGFGVKIVGVGPTTGVVVPAGRMAVVAWNGSDFVTLGAVVDLTASGNVTVAGTTTLAALTASGNVSFDGGTFVFNDSGADRDARFEGDGDPNLLFLDASTDRVGIGTNSPAYKLDLRGGVIAAGNGTIVGGISYSTRPEIGAISNHPCGFITNNTTQMLLDTSGNLGIGTVSPAAKLDINSTGAGVQTALNLRNDADTLGVVGTAVHLGYSSPAANYGTRIVNYGNPALSFAGDLVFERGTGSGYSESMRLDSSGNLGLGVTPSAWSGYGAPVLEMPSGGTVVGRGSTTIGGNFYYSGGAFRYVINSAASYYNQNAGNHAWFTAPSGTAGNAISFTQAMTLDASGNLGVGVTDPATYGGVIVGRPVSGANFAVRSLTGIGGSGTGVGLDALNDGAGSVVDFGLRGTSIQFRNASGETARFTAVGDFIHQVNGTAPTLSTNSTMSFELTSNTSLKVVVRGTDGVTRSVSLTLS